MTRIHAVSRDDYKGKIKAKRKRDMVFKELRTRGPRPRRIEGKKASPPEVTVRDWEKKWDVC